MSKPNRKRVVVITIMMVAIFGAYSGTAVWVWSQANAPLPTRTSQFLIGIYLTNASSIQPSDINLLLTLTYVGAPVVGQEVDIAGTAELNSSLAQTTNITRILVGFQNALKWNAKDRYSFPLFGTLNMLKTNDPLIMRGATELYWEIEGTFYPSVSLVIGQEAYPPVLDMGAGIEIFPVDHLSQEQTAVQNTELTWAILALTAFGLASAEVELWDKRQPK